MNRPLTLMVVACILIAGLTGNLWLRSEQKRIDQREAIAREVIGQSSGRQAAAAGSAPSDAKTSERVKSAPRDAVAFVNSIKELEHRRKRGEIDGVAFSRGVTLADYASASPEELLALAAELKGSGLYPGMVSLLRQEIVGHLALIDPKAGTMLATEDGDGRTFQSCLCAWIKTDAKGALAWMEKAEPPLDLSSFEEIGPLNLNDMFLLACLAVDPAGGPLPPPPEIDNFPAAYPLMTKALSPADLSTVVSRVSKLDEVREPEIQRLAASLVAGYPDLQTGLRVLFDADLPLPLLSDIAAKIIAYQDPPGARRGIECYQEATSGEARASGLREIVSMWARSDRRSALEWIGEQPESREKAELLEATREPAAP